LLLDDTSPGLLIRLDTGQSVPLPSPCSFPFAFSPDGRRLVTAGPASRDGRFGPASREGSRTARVWDVATAKPVGLPLVHRWLISAAAFHINGQTLMTGDVSGQVQLWSTETGEPLGSAMAHAGMVNRLEIAADGMTLVVSLANALSLWELGS